MNEGHRVRVNLVNAFSHNGQGGSPTGIVLSPGPLTDGQMQRIAAQSQASHVVFAGSSNLADVDYRVRFFTRNGEIKNCAHATIAVHWYLARETALAESRVVWQETMTGRQQVWINVRGGRYSVRFAQREVDLASVGEDLVSEVLDGLRITATDLADEYTVQLASPGSKRFLVPVRSVPFLLKLEPDLAYLEMLCRKEDSIGCFVYSVERTKQGYVAHGRMFAPAIGVAEDIVNGNSSGCLGAYLLSGALEKGMDLKELSLEVFQGMAFDTTGLVKVIARQVEQRIKTYIEGTAWYSGEQIT
jgi:PhzF family phenazine biosynthesis protein